MSQVGQAVEWTRRDLRWGSRQWVVNEVAGHRLVPRLLRHLLLRSVGVHLEALDISSGVTITGGHRLTIGAGTFVNHAVHLDAVGGIAIGRNCAIGPGVMVLSTSHPLGDTGWAHDVVHRPVTIGDHVWIGARAMILPGASIPSGAVIAAGSVVTGILDEHGVYAGTPARLRRSFTPSHTAADHA